MTPKQQAEEYAKLTKQTKTSKQHVWLDGYNACLKSDAVMGLVEALETVKNRMATRNVQASKDEAELIITISRAALTTFRSAAE